MGKIQDSDYKSALNSAINNPFKVITFSSGYFQPSKVASGDLDNIAFYQTLYGFEVDSPIAIVKLPSSNEYIMLGEGKITPQFYTRTDNAYRGNYSINEKLFKQDGTLDFSKETIKNYCGIRSKNVGTFDKEADFTQMYDDLKNYQYNRYPYYCCSLLTPDLFKKGVSANEVGLFYPVANKIYKDGSTWASPWDSDHWHPIGYTSQFDAIRHNTVNGYTSRLQDDFNIWGQPNHALFTPFRVNAELPETSSDFYNELAGAKVGPYLEVQPNFLTAKHLMGIGSNEPISGKKIDESTYDQRKAVLDRYNDDLEYEPSFDQLYFHNFFNYEDSETLLQGDYYYLGGSVKEISGLVFQPKLSNIQINAINIPIFASDDDEKNKEEAEKFLKDPENYVPDDTMSLNTTDPNGKPSSIVPDTPDDEDETSDDSDSRDSSDFPDSVDNTSCNRLYEVNRGELNGFINWFWNGGSQFDQSFIDWMTGACGDITQAVISCHFIPYDFEPPTTDMQVKLSYLDTSFRWDAVTDNVRRKFLGEISIGYNQKNKSFLDFSPYTELQLYLPYAGVISLDNNIFMGKKVALDLICDLQDGSGNYAISVVSNGIKTMVDEVPVQLGISIPFTLSDASQKNANLLNSVINSSLGVIGGAMSGSPLMIAGSVSNFSQNVPPSKQIGSVVGAPGLGLPQQPMLYIKRPVFNYPDNYGFHVGYPCYKNYTLNQVSGYTICENPKIRSFSKSITDNEYNEIINLLREGVIV